MLPLFRKAVLPIEAEMQKTKKAYLQEEVEDVDMYAQHMHDIKEGIYQKAITNIGVAQRQQKKDYDEKHCKKVVRSPCIVTYKLHNICHTYVQ